MPPREIAPLNRAKKTPLSRTPKVEGSVDPKFRTDPEKGDWSSARIKDRVAQAERRAAEMAKDLARNRGSGDSDAGGQPPVPGSGD